MRIHLTTEELRTIIYNHFGNDGELYVTIDYVEPDHIWKNRIDYYSKELEEARNGRVEKCHDFEVEEKNPKQKYFLAL